MNLTVNVPGCAWSPQIYELLLSDRNTQQNIVWATDDYAELGAAYTAQQPIAFESLCQDGQSVIHPGFLKNRVRLTARQKSKAEVFTPTWMCNVQANLVDKYWFGREVVFSSTVGKEWTTVREKIEFPNTPGKDWQAYVKDLRLEITCGEAPYLASRYDAVSGEPIPIADRVGFLDRKLRIVTENTTSEAEWLEWVEIAFKCTYGFELQGDNLLIARANFLATYIEYMLKVWQREPTEQELEKIAYIISWNLMQMNALTMCTPTTEPLPCKIMDWNTGTTIDAKDALD